MLFIHATFLLCEKGDKAKHRYDATTAPLLDAWQPRSCLFMLLRTLNALPQPVCGHLKGFSPVWLWLCMRRLLGREKALLHVGQM